MCNDAAGGAYHYLADAILAARPSLGSEFAKRAFLIKKDADAARHSWVDSAVSQSQLAHGTVSDSGEISQKTCAFSYYGSSFEGIDLDNFELLESDGDGCLSECAETE
eukprot:2797598-Karenia_brevis.AAC.1